MVDEHKRFSVAGRIGKMTGVSKDFVVFKVKAPTDNYGGEKVVVGSEYTEVIVPKQHVAFGWWTEQIVRMTGGYRKGLDGLTLWED